jgi:hypothetical protein
VRETTATATTTSTTTATTTTIIITILHHHRNNSLPGCSPSNQGFQQCGLYVIICCVVL